MRTILALLLLSVSVASSQSTTQLADKIMTSKEVALLAFPEINKPESIIHERMAVIDKFLFDKKIKFYGDPNKPLILAIMAAREVYIIPEIAALSPGQQKLYNDTNRSIDNWLAEYVLKNPEEPKVTATPSMPPPGMVKNPNSNDIFNSKVPAMERLASYSEPEYVTPEQAAQINAERAARQQAEAAKLREANEERRHQEILSAIENK